MPIRNVFLASVLLWLITGHALAFKLNPCMRILTLTSDGPLQAPVNSANGCGILDPQLQLAVHEHLTLATIQEYGAPAKWEPVTSGDRVQQKFNYLKAQPWSVKGGVEHSTINLIKGAWWNDDPEMYLWGQKLDFIKGLAHINEVFSNKSDTYEGGQRNCSVPANVHLAHQSHYGNLQHLHFMSTLGSDRSAKERVASTTKNALVWMEFAYGVATGAYAPDASFTKEDEERLGLPSLARNLCVQPASVKVRSIFARTGAGTIAHRNQITPDVALGSMLHVLQDSFSPAHTCRVKAQSGDKTIAALYNVYNYNDQSPDDHKKLDVFPAWFAPILAKHEHRYANDSVAVGSWLIGAVDKRLPWSEVRTHLLDTAFAPTADFEQQAPVCV